MRYGAFSVLAADDDEDAAPPPPAAPPLPPPVDLPEGEPPVTCDPGDHAETPLEAFRDVAPLLGRLAARLALSPATLRLYDPYFCTGACKAHLASLGFPCVHNENVDFYSAAASGSVPAHDVLLSNPPFTRDHLERIFRFCWANAGRPYFLLVPQFVARKPWLLSHLDAELSRGKGSARLLYLGPKTQPYVFSAPSTRQDVREKRGGGEAAAAAPPASFPVSAGKFQAVWVVGGLGAHHAPLLDWWRRVCAPEADCVVASSPAELPQFARSAAALTPAEWRWKRKARDGEGAQAEEGKGGEEGQPAPKARATGGRKTR